LTVAPASHESAAADNDLSSTTSQHIVEKISPFPKRIAVRSRKRKVQAAEVITSSPFKQRLLEQAKTYEQKKKNENNKQATMKTGQQKWLKRGLAEKTSAEEENLKVKVRQGQRHSMASSQKNLMMWKMM